MIKLSLDKDGYLINLNDCSDLVIKKLAMNERIILTNDHWEVLNLLRTFYKQFNHTPNQRIFTKYVANNLGKDKGNSLYLMKLFDSNPVKMAAKIAGLPRPTNCF